MKPTRCFSPFGSDGPKVLLFGKETGDWNTNRFQQEGDHLKIPGLYFRFNGLAERYHFPSILMPTLTDCNAEICNPKDLAVNIQNGVGSVVLQKGVKADGVVLPHGLSGAIASADCPTIIAYCSTGKVAIMAHGGYKSVVAGVVDAIVQKTREYRFTEMNVFLTCGIAGHNYERMDVAPIMPERECVVGNFVDLRKLICLKFHRHGIYDITADTIDTYGDRNGGSEHIWHSYRRGETPTEKARRNLVLVVNK